MPLGLFGGTSSSKPQVLNDGSTSARDKKDNVKGTTLKLTNTSVTIEKQLAEGGFAIVYLVTDKKNRKFALKRQFVLDNQKQLDACARECKIVMELRGHKNIVEYVDHMITVNKSGQYDCTLLTVYHKRNVLQLMNDRISSNMYLSPNEVLNIFCDICEAVGRLHHSKTPVIHRDLKVENILIDERNRAAPPIFVLCDFGSATTKTMSINTHPAAFIQEEIERNTTLCYRAPEMVDIYGGQTIGTKADIWSLGVMLYRLCYFALPFEESALAIQNGIYTPFPTNPAHPAAIRAIIHLLLDVDVNRRPSIYECASLAFEAFGKPTPIENVNSAARPSLEQAIIEMKEGKPRNQRQASPARPVVAAEPTKQVQAARKEESLISTVETTNNILSGELTTTSVNPRLRPKASANFTAIPSISPVPMRRVVDETVFRTESDSRQSFSGESSQPEAETGGPLSCPLLKPSDLGFTDLDNPAIPRNRAATDSTALRQVATSKNEANAATQETAAILQQHRRNVSDTSQISRSAFKPYSQTAAPSKSVVRSVENIPVKRTAAAVEWNPFLAAPFPSEPDDCQFAEAFDVVGRSEKPDDNDDASSIDSRDPFGAAPFDQLTSSTTPETLSAAAMNERELIRMISQLDDEVDGKAKGGTNEEDSEVDEQRMKARRRYSYENIDGVGDDASSDSRGKTDRDDSEDYETDECSRKGGDTSHDEDGEGSSQNTVGSEDGEGGNRPLLEDDGLEDDDDHELLSSFSTISSNFHVPLFVGTTTNTNPFLRDELTPKISPATVQTTTVRISDENRPSTDDDWDLGDRWTDRRDTVFEKPSQHKAVFTDFAPATLPRQVTPLSAVSRLKPELPTTAPVSIIPSMSTTSFPDNVENQEGVQEKNQLVVGTLIQVGAPTNVEENPSRPQKVIEPPMPSKPIRTTTPATYRQEPIRAASTKPNIDFVEGPKTPKTVKSKKGEKKSKVPFNLERSDNDETDGSEAEMCVTDGATTSGKKKKKGAFVLRSSHPSITDYASPPPVLAVKKTSKDKKSSAIKRASTGALNNASFVNSSFQYEDMDMPNRI